MKIKDLFRRPVDRDIDTVIKADSPINISTEVVEYVITAEIQKKIDHLFEAYVDPGSANGVWISGFFGSGKSHLLKILSYVLSNTQSEGYHAGELFAEKIDKSSLLKANIEKAVAQEADCILFNIEQKADTTARESGDALVSIFYKVFYEHLGFYGSTRHIARFEFDLYKKGDYKAFVTAFNDLSEETWVDARPNYWDPFVQESIAQALGQLYNRDAADYEQYISRYEDNFNESVEDLTEQILTHLDMIDPNKRLNFLIDEVGQFVGAHPGLLLSLQTLAETFASQTNMRVWIFVTAQDNLDLALGKEKVAETDEFSKIMGRFKIQLSLTSANVDEVIQQRLLAKNDEGKQEVRKVWEEHHHGLETLISFSEAGIQLKNNFAQDAFTRQYPFLTYQFDLFQQVIKKLAIHEAFQGRYASVGERSMLGVFQDVMKALKDEKTGALVSVDRLFDGLRISLRSGIQNVVQLAENNIDDPFTLRVLKVLFMVKYFDQFKATKRNVSVMLYDHLQPDLEDHEENLTRSLRRLEQEVYITRNGDTYEFLTDEEKDLEQEISAREIDESQLMKTLDQVLFSQIIRDTKLPYQKDTVPYTRMIDEKMMSREYDLAIEFITPMYAPLLNNPNFGTQHSMLKSTRLVILLKDDENLWKDLETYVKTNEYIRMAPKDTMSEQKLQFLHIKGRQNETRLREISQRLEQRIGESDFYLAGELLSLPVSGQPKIRIIAGFERLFSKVYRHYDLVSRYASTENDFINVLRNPDSSLFQEDQESMDGAGQQVLSYILNCHGQHERITLADLRKHFSGQPFGWNEWALWHIMLILDRKARIELQKSGEDVHVDQFEATFRNSSNHTVTTVLPRTEVPPHMVRQARDFYRELFDQTLSETEAKKVFRAFVQELTQVELPALRMLYHQKSDYPFLAPMEEYIRLLEEIPRSDMERFYAQLDAMEDPILDLKEDKVRLIREFWNGSQRQLYDSMRKVVISDATNLGYVNRHTYGDLKAFFDDPAPYESRKLAEAKEKYENLRGELKSTLEEKRQHTIAQLKEILQRLQEDDLVLQLTENERNEVIRPLQELLKSAEDENQIFLLENLVERAENKYINQLNKAQQLLARTNGDEKETRFVRMSKVRFHSPVHKITNASEVDLYVDELRKELLRYLDNDIHISL